MSSQIIFHLSSSYSNYYVYLIFIQDINDWMDMTTTQAGRLAEDRILFRQKVQEATSRQEISWSRERDLIFIYHLYLHLSFSSLSLTIAFNTYCLLLLGFEFTGLYNLIWLSIILSVNPGYFSFPCSTYRSVCTYSVFQDLRQPAVQWLWDNLRCSATGRREASRETCQHIWLQRLPVSGVWAIVGEATHCNTTLISCCILLFSFSVEFFLITPFYWLPTKIFIKGHFITFFCVFYTSAILLETDILSKVILRANKEVRMGGRNVSNPWYTDKFLVMTKK